MKNRNLELIDIAFGKRCKQSSYSQWSKYNESGSAVAGASERDWSFHTDLEVNPWWSVDFGWEYKIEKIVINNRRLVPERARWIIVQVSSDEIVWSEIFAGFHLFTFEDPLKIDLGGEISARLMKISIKGIQYLHLNRVQVFAKPESIYQSGISAKIIEKNECVRTNISCAVIGTSNSLSKNGYTKYIKAKKNINLLENFSLGASHSGLLIYKISELPETPYDYIIIDTAPNDQGAINAKCHNEIIGDKFTESAVRNVLARGAIPILMIIPFQTSLEIYLKTGLSPETLTNSKVIASKWSIPIVDGYELISKVVQLSGRDAGWFFDDPYHPTEFVHRLLADMLTDMMERTIKSDEVVQNYSSDGKFYPIDNIKKVENYIIKRKNSFVDFKFLKLNENEGFNITIGCKESLGGVLLNMSGSTGAIALNDRIIKRLDFSQSVPPLCMAVWNFQEQVEGPNIFVKCVKIDGRPMERTEHSQRNVVLGDDGAASVEIGGFVTLGKDVSASYYRPLIRGPAPEIEVNISSGTFRGILS